MGYCQIPDVADCFPAFQRNAPGSVTDARIQSWIDQAAARIDSALMQRGFDPQSPSVPLTTRQTNWLLMLNADFAIGELGRVLEGGVTLQPGEMSTVAGRRKNYETVLADIRLGRYDAFFGLESRLSNEGDFGYGGAETERSTPGEREENRAFGINQKL